MDSRNRNPPDEGDLLEAPPEFRGALLRLRPARVFVPPTVDQAVLRAARSHLERQPSAAWRAFRSWRFWPAFATACLLFCALGYFVAKQALIPFASKSVAREDINGDGRVDILDALQLARQSEAGAKPDGNLDLNGDGVVDRRDAEIIAAHAVKLEKGGS